MADDGAEANKNDRTWKSWVGIVLFVLGAGLLGVFFFGDQLSWLWRGIFVGVFVLATAVAVVFSEWIKLSTSTDKGPFDLYSLSHGSAGLLFGAWFLPLWWVLVITIAWEMFEASVPGWGMREPFVNRATDVGLAVAGWFLVVGLGAAFSDPPGQFPWLISVGSLACKACGMS